MSQRRKTSFGAVAGAVATVALLTMTSACGAGSTGSSSPTTAAPTPVVADPAADLVGKGCASYDRAVPVGAGSFAGMAQHKLTVATADNPRLSMLDAAITGNLNPAVNLSSTLSRGEFTVFAPVDSAFAKLPPATLRSFDTAAGARTLQQLLSFHVVSGELSLKRVVGTHRTIDGSRITVSGSGDDLTVGPDQAKILCGAIKTSNAVVYLIDSVMTPPA